MRIAGAVLAATGFACMGLHLPLLVRACFTTADHVQWEAAGRPDSWRFRRHSQPRTYDLVIAVLWGGALAGFFLMLMLGAR